MEKTMIFFTETLQSKDKEKEIEKYLTEKIGVRCIVLNKEFKDFIYIKEEEERPYY